jgi:hypothetical protein
MIDGLVKEPVDDAIDADNDGNDGCCAVQILHVSP